jgi:hypothetical protein
VAGTGTKPLVESGKWDDPNWKSTVDSEDVTRGSQAFCPRNDSYSGTFYGLLMRPGRQAYSCTQALHPPLVSMETQTQKLSILYHLVMMVPTRNDVEIGDHYFHSSVVGGNSKILYICQ